MANGSTPSIQFYDALPHYFLEFDVLDVATNAFLSGKSRRALLAGLPISSVPILHTGEIASAAALKALLRSSAFKSRDWRTNLAEAAKARPHAPSLVLRQTDASDLMEGLYIKIEEQDRVVERFKYVRHDFLKAVLDSESHWLSRPILANQLAPTSHGRGS
jgi:hypothetical protein